MRKGHPTPKAPQNQPVGVEEIPLVSATTFANFSAAVATGENGARMLKILLPTGELLQFPFNAESAKRTGEAMLAPSVEVPDGVPRGLL